MVYIVKIDYTEFKFNSLTTAGSFMELAKTYATKDIRVELTIEKEE